MTIIWLAYAEQVECTRGQKNQFMSLEKRCPIWHSSVGGMLDFAELDGTNNMEGDMNPGLCVAQEFRHGCSIL